MSLKAVGSTPLTVPAWYYRLPHALSGRRALVVDQHVLRAYYVGRDEPPGPLAFVFASDLVQVQIGRPVLAAALSGPALDAERRAEIWGALTEGQRRGVLRLQTASELTPPLLRTHTAFVLLLRATLSAADALGLADAVVRRVPLLTLKDVGRAGIERAVRSSPVQRFLVEQGLWTNSAELLLE